MKTAKEMNAKSALYKKDPTIDELLETADLMIQIATEAGQHSVGIEVPDNLDGAFRKEMHSRGYSYRLQKFQNRMFGMGIVDWSSGEQMVPSTWKGKHEEHINNSPRVFVYC